MFSFEPFTLKEIGSAQVFQTGETYKGEPLHRLSAPARLVFDVERHIQAPRGIVDAGNNWRCCRRPDPVNPGDMTRLMASVRQTRTGPIATALLAAWGRIASRTGNSNAFLFESNISWLDRNYLYSRAELVDKELPHTHDGVPQPVDLMKIGAFTLGYTRDLTVRSFGGIGLGADMTMYYVPGDLQESYGAPVSFHAFLRFCLTRRLQARNTITSFNPYCSSHASRC